MIRLPAAAICCLVLAGQHLRLPEPAVEVRFQSGHFLLLVSVKAAPGDRSDRAVLLLDKQGRVVRRASLEIPSMDYRRLAVRDAVLTADQRILVFATMQRRLAETQQGLLELPADGAPVWKDQGSLVCERLLPDGSAVWCLGFDLDALVRRAPFDILYRIQADGSSLPWLPVRKLGLRRMENGTMRGPWAHSVLGPPQLFPGSGGVAWAWMPMVQTLARLEAGRGQVDLETVPLQVAGRSYVSLTATASGRVFGLFPLRGPEEETEALDTRYGFYERDQTTSRWRLEPRLGDALRGAQLVGADGESLLVWFRSERRVEWRTAPAVSPQN